MYKWPQRNKSHNGCRTFNQLRQIGFNGPTRADVVNDLVQLRVGGVIDDQIVSDGGPWHPVDDTGMRGEGLDFCWSEMGYDSSPVQFCSIHSPSSQRLQIGKSPSVPCFCGLPSVAGESLNHAGDGARQSAKAVSVWVFICLLGDCAHFSSPRCRFAAKVE